jgi:hypothetical protein
MSTRTFEIVKKELDLAREQVKELEREIHGLAIGAYFAFVANDSDKRGIIAVADDRIDFLTREFGFTCRILDGNILVGKNDWVSRELYYSGWQVPIDGESLEVPDFGSDIPEIGFVVAAFSSKEKADAWIEGIKN